MVGTKIYIMADGTEWTADEYAASMGMSFAAACKELKDLCVETRSSMPKTEGAPDADIGADLSLEDEPVQEDEPAQRAEQAEETQELEPAAQEKEKLQPKPCKHKGREPSVFILPNGKEYTASIYADEHAVTSNCAVNRLKRMAVKIRKPDGTELENPQHMPDFVPGTRVNARDPGKKKNPPRMTLYTLDNGALHTAENYAEVMGCSLRQAQIELGQMCSSKRQVSIEKAKEMLAAQGHEIVNPALKKMRPDPDTPAPDKPTTSEAKTQFLCGGVDDGETPLERCHARTAQTIEGLPTFAFIARLFLIRQLNLISQEIALQEYTQLKGVDNERS